MIFTILCIILYYNPFRKLHLPFLIDQIFTIHDTRCEHIYRYSNKKEYIYIYIDVYICIYIYVYIDIYIYVYIDIYIYIQI